VKELCDEHSVLLSLCPITVRYREREKNFDALVCPTKGDIVLALADGAIQSRHKTGVGRIREPHRDDWSGRREPPQICDRSNHSVLGAYSPLPNSCCFMLAYVSSPLQCCPGHVSPWPKYNPPDRSIHAAGQMTPGPPTCNAALATPRCGG
jgi:hypothetical protein